MSAQSNSQQSVVKAVEGHVEQLIADHKRLSERNRDLTTQCDKLRASKRELLERVASLEKELSGAEIALGLTKGGGSSAQSDKSKQRARAYVNRLMREIDACLTYMTSPSEGGEGDEGGE